MKTDKILALILEAYYKNQITQAATIELINDLFTVAAPSIATPPPTQYPWIVKDTTTIPVRSIKIGDDPNSSPIISYSTTHVQ